MTASEKGRVLKLDVAAAIVVHYSQNPQISPRVVFLSRSKFFEPKLKPKKKDFSRRYLDISFIRLPIEWARHWFSTFPTPNNIVPSIILSRMIGERTISFVRCKKGKKQGKKDIRGAQSTSKRWKHPASFQSAAILRRNLCPLCLSVFQFSQKRLETRVQLIIITIFFFFFSNTPLTNKNFFFY